MKTPLKSTLIKSITRDIDQRGNIISIVDNNIQNVSLITCNSGSLRSNHYHKKDFHFMYVLEGEIDYFYKEIKKDKINYLKVMKNETIFTPNNEIHATYFPVKTVLIVSSNLPRDQKTYENDTVRVEFINHNNINQMLQKHAPVK